ncbi:MAG: hypothetical protein ACKPB7_24120, partial [Sphaerospermopsis kisseleviana]
VDIFTLNRTTITEYVNFCNDIQHFWEKAYLQMWQIYFSGDVYCSSSSCQSLNPGYPDSDNKVFM